MTIDERRLAEITRELCEHIGALHDAAASAEKRAEDAEGWENAWERDCEAVASALGFAPGEWVSTGLAQSVADLRARAEYAERKLAAIVAADRELNRLALDCGALGDEFCRAQSAVDNAIHDAAPVAERHDRKVRVKELRRMARKTADQSCPLYGDQAHYAADWLRDEADRIERGEV